MYLFVFLFCILRIPAFNVLFVLSFVQRGGIITIFVSIIHGEEYTFLLQQTCTAANKSPLHNRHTDDETYTDEFPHMFTFHSSHGYSKRFQLGLKQVWSGYATEIGWSDCIWGITQDMTCWKNFKLRSLTLASGQGFQEELPWDINLLVEMKELSCNLRTYNRGRNCVRRSDLIQLIW